MVKIRLARGGTKNDPFYRIVAIDEKRKRGGKPIEILGYWHPAKKVKKIDPGRISHWKDLGAKTTNAVDKLLAE